MNKNSVKDGKKRQSINLKIEKMKEIVEIICATVMFVALMYFLFKSEKR